MSEDWLPFVRMQGLGNDYVYLDERQVTVGDPVHWARKLSERHRGMGSDGLIILREDPEYPCRMEMYNADGSRAEMCGNGIRCVAALAHERGYARSPAFTLGTDDGPRPVEVLGGSPTRVRVGMGPARFEAVEETVEAAGRSFTGSIISVGNPHFVIVIDRPTAEYPVHEHGPALESHPRFPNRTNVEFVRAVDRTHVDFRVWERGSGETQACGTGATAAAAALHRRGLVEAISTVHLLGGDLEIEVREDGELFMTGPAVTSYRGEFPRSLVEEV